MTARSGTTHVALLRGINVGGKNKLPMKDLVALFSDAGAREVSTYIASGNVLFSASAALAKKLPLTVAQAIEAQLGLKIPIVLRTTDELALVALGNPYVPGETRQDILAVMFLADEPSPKALASLDPARSPLDEYVVKGRDIYVRCPSTFAKTKLTNDYFDRRLSTVSTARNWRTVLKLVELSRG